MENESQEVYLKVFFDWTDRFRKLSDQEFGQLIRAAIAYKRDGVAGELDGRVELLFDVIRPDMDRDAARSRELTARRRAAGQKGGQSRWRKQANDGSDSRTGLCHDEDSSAMVCHTEDSIEEEKEEEQEKEQEEEKDASSPSQTYVCPSGMRAHTHTPTQEQIRSYCRERQNGIDPDYFFDYYAANGWRMGQNPISDWRALVRAWEKREAQRASGPGPAGARQGPVRRRNSLLNYKTDPGPAFPQEIDLDPNEL